MDKNTLYDICTESEIIEDITVNNHTIINLAALGRNGVFLFITTNAKDIEKETEHVLTMYKLQIAGVFTFVMSNDKSFFFTNHNLIEITELYDKVENLYENTLRPVVDLNYIGFETDYEMLFKPELPKEYLDDEGNPVSIDGSGELKTYKTFVCQASLDNIRSRLERGDYISDKDTIIRDGITYKRHYVSKLGYAYNEVYYPVATDSPIMFFYMALFGGCFGIHKFRTGEILKGLFYLLTCGGFGIFYILDIIQICTGCYYINRIEYSEDASKRYKTRLYLDSLHNVKMSVLGIISSFLIAFVLYSLIYTNLFVTISSFLSGTVNGMF